MKKIAVLVSLCLLSMILLTACGGGGGNGGGSSDVSMEGKWALSAMEIGGEDYLAMLTELDPEMNFADEMYLEFSADDKVTMVMSGETEEGTYTLDGTKLTIDIEGEAIEATLNGNTFTMTEGEGDEAMSMSYTKAQ